MVIDHATKTSKQEVLFDFIADKVAAFMKRKNITKKLPLGFTFSFPVNQTSLTSGTLIRWTKDFKADGAEGKDIIQLLRAAFQRRGVRREGRREGGREGTSTYTACMHTYIHTHYTHTHAHAHTHTHTPHTTHTTHLVGC